MVFNKTDKKRRQMKYGYDIAMTAAYYFTTATFFREYLKAFREINRCAVLLLDALA